MEDARREEREMVDQNGTPSQQEDGGGGRIICNPAIRRLLKVVAVGFVMLSLLFVYFHERPDLKLVVRLSAKRFIHGWPVTWLYRSWQPYMCCDSPETTLHPPRWLWTELPGEVCNYVPRAMFVDAALAVAILIAVMQGLGLRAVGRRFCANVATAVALSGFFALPTLLATYQPGTLTLLANAGVFFAVVFVGYTVLACVFRRVVRGGSGGGSGGVEDRGNPRA